ncbi:Endonuclease/exonuclease/phosphatase, partial [Armillaria novae-zelandiae]
TKAWWVVASLNMKGRGDQNPLKSKWSDINRIIKEQKISILTLQETHLSEEYAEEIAKVYGKTMKILFSANECHATGKAGVAVVLNKNLIQTEGVIMTNLIPGQAILVQIPWNGGGVFNWLAVYAPNDKLESKLIWETLSREWEMCRLPRLNRMSGDFSLTALHRLLAHEDKRDTVNTFTTFRKNMALHDGWQNTNPDTKNFTFTQMAGNFLYSWIDRIYVSTHRLKDCEEWEIKDAPLSTDHRAVNVKMTHPTDPYVGKGQWTMPLHLLKNGKAIKEVEDVVKAMVTGVVVRVARTESENPQMIYAKGK